MSWFKPKFVFVVVLSGGIMVAGCFSGCKPDARESGTALKYFDIKAYFKAEIARQTKLNRPVVKTVSHNGVTENKTARIPSWENELDLFAGSDINRPAWKSSYTVVANDDFLVYKAKYPELKMRQMVIKKDKQKVKWILIFNQTKNILYRSNEKLSYFPDSLYLIEKVQRVRLMGTNNYKIQGLIGK